ncbi:MAG: hypothetical protein ACRDZU_04385 [Acidimicrobiales bacterium]
MTTDGEAGPPDPEAWLTVPVDAGDATPDTPTGQHPGRGRRWLAVVVGVAVIAIVGATFAVLRPDASTAGHPDEWDARVQPLVDFVEGERNLFFEHPVQVDFLSIDEWEERAATEATDAEAEMSDEDRRLLESGASLFRALGLAEGELDLLESFEQISASGTVGRYQFDDQRISVRGSELDIESKKTLVHELTHALQDQRFDIGDRYDEDAEETDEDQLDALVEGDAERIEAAWTDQLSEARRAELDAAMQSTGDEAAGALAGVPDSVLTFVQAPYILGRRFIDALLASGGNEAVNEAFVDPPGPEEHVLDPLSYLDDDQPIDVDSPPLTGSEVAIENLDGEFGALGLFVMLAERIDPLDALVAVDGWAGDAFVAFERDHTTCVRATIAAEDDLSADALVAALENWRDAMPAAAAAAVERTGTRTTFETCDPGPDADVLDGDGRSSDAIAIPSVRIDLAIEVLREDGTVAQARCFSRGFLGLLTVEEIFADVLPPDRQAALQEGAVALGQECSRRR